MRACVAILFTVVALSGQTPVYYADAIVPQMPVGCNWNTSIILVNITNTDVAFTVNFWPSAGISSPNATPVPRLVPISGVGTVGSVGGTIPANGSFTITSNEPGVVTTDCSGWAEVNSAQTLAGYVVVTQQLMETATSDLGGATVAETTTLVFEASVPLSSRFANVFSVPFDTVAFNAPAIALVNPSFQTAASVTVTYYDNQGIQICQELRSLYPGEQQAFSLSPTASTNPVCAAPGDKSSYTKLQGHRGVVLVSTSSLEFSGVGLGFGAFGFVAFPAQTPIGQ
jgi:hypothetical protein